MSDTPITDAAQFHCTDDAGKLVSHVNSDEMRKLERQFNKVEHGEVSEFSGMSLRTYLAGQALAGLLANGRYLDDMSKAAKSDVGLLAKGTAFLAVQNADALIAELNKEKP